MKTIAIFHPSAELYGADRIMVLAAKALSDYKPIIYLPKEGDLIDHIRNEIPTAEIKILDQMPVISRGLFSPKGIFTTAVKYFNFRKFIRRENSHYQFDQIYVNTLACSLLLPALNQLKTPIFTHVHEILENPVIAAKLTAKLAFKYSGTVISVSQAVQENLHRLCKKRKGKSRVVHNGIQPISAKKVQKKRQLSFYLFGRIKPEKGQWYLLDALNTIPKNELKDVEFNLVGGTLAGNEALKEDLERRIRAYELTGIVHLKGFTKDISVEISKADVCLIPSLMKDPFPTTVLEAMSLGKAIIASDTGGAKEAISNNQSGYIVPPNDPKVFANIIRKLIHDRNLVRKIGHQAKITFQENFTLQCFNERWLTAIQTN